MEIILFFVALIATVGFFAFAAKLFASTFMYLTKKVQFGLVCLYADILPGVWHLVAQFSKQAARSVQAVMQKKSTKSEPAPEPVRPGFVVDQEYPEEVYSVPAYIRQGKVIIW